jgi:hypothetical protein
MFNRSLNHNFLGLAEVVNEHDEIRTSGDINMEFISLGNSVDSISMFLR